MAKKYKPFATGRQAADWNHRNCGSCKKGYDARRSEYNCKLEKAMDEARCGDGQITEDEARAIGYLDNIGCHLWECPGWERGRK